MKALSIKQPWADLILAGLKGKRLGCFCRPGELCHGDVLVGEVCGG